MYRNRADIVDRQREEVVNADEEMQVCDDLKLCSKGDDVDTVSNKSHQRYF